MARRKYFDHDHGADGARRLCSLRIDRISRPLQLLDCNLLFPVTAQFDLELGMDLGTLAIAMGSAWLSGINLYATVLTLGLLERFHMTQLPGDLSYLGHTWVLAAAGFLYAVQFVADKIPAVDSIWDLVHTFIRVPAGAILAAGAFAHFDPKIQLIAMLAGGGIALTSHGTKTATRLAVNTSPEPFSNFLLSLLGDAIAFGGALLMSVHPIVLLVIALCGCVVSILLFRWIWHSLAKMFKPRARVLAA